MQVNTRSLLRGAGLAAMVAGVVYAGIQPIHPPDALASVTTSAWAIITPLKVVMCLLFLVGWTGLYAHQLERAGWLGLAGFLALSMCWAFQLSFIFAEAFVMPLLASTAPMFVDGYLGIAAGRASDVNLGALPALYALTGALYVLGGILFGVASFRARVLPRWAAGLLMVASLLTPAAAVLPHQVQRYAAIPVAVAAVGLGYALWSQRRAQAVEPADAQAGGVKWARSA